MRLHGPCAPGKFVADTDGLAVVGHAEDHRKDVRLPAENRRIRRVGPVETARLVPRQPVQALADLRGQSAVVIRLRIAYAVRKSRRRLQRSIPYHLQRSIGLRLRPVDKDPI